MKCYYAHMAEPLDPSKFHVLNLRQKLYIGLAVALILLVLSPLCGFLYYRFAINRPSQVNKDITYDLKSGTGVFDVARELTQLGAINSEFLFDAYVLGNGLDKTIQAGVYKIPSGSSITQVVEQLQHGTNDIKLTFLEGWRLEEFAREAVSKLKNVDYENFVMLAKDSEGMLFPDTYYVNADIDEVQLIDLLQQTFATKTKDILTPDALSRIGLTKPQALIFASIVEREVHNTTDRPIVAGILIKRWKNKELIGADATTQYAVSRNRVGCATSNVVVCPADGMAMEMMWWPSDLTVDDLNFDSPYNTRKNVGLPPSPISSFSINALESVLNYKNTEYNYYLTDGDGVTHFARTYDEHLNNINKYIKN